MGHSQLRRQMSPSQKEEGSWLPAGTAVRFDELGGAARAFRTTRKRLQEETETENGYSKDEEGSDESTKSGQTRVSVLCTAD
mmetsp:Transcript_2113/g.4449  ORF Transcript_2113/g.4449 Transcript_2113/m.4449 type:complete len:82 (+) Transcript_2113:1796-2041(+)